MNSALDLKEQGNRKYRKGDYRGAIEDYSQAIKLKPDYADAYYNRGNSNYSIQDYEGAIEDFSQAIKLNPDDAEAYYKRGNSKKAIQDYKGAIKDYSEAIKLKPDYADAYQFRGNSNYSILNYKGAIEDYSEAIKLKPDYAEAYNNRGVNKENIQDYKGAIEDYNQAIKLKPDFADAYINRGNNKQVIHDYKGAIEDFSQAIKLKPDYAMAYNNRGNSKNNIQDYEGAIEDYSQAIKLKPDYHEAYINRGISKNNSQQYQGAIKDYSQAIKLKPDDPEAYNNRGVSQKNIKYYKGAQSDYLKALSLSQQPSPLQLFNLANLYLSIDSKKEALQRYSQGVNIFQKYTEADLKKKFNLSNQNIGHIKNSILIFEKLQKQAGEIRQQAQRKDRKDILQQLDKFDEAIFSARVKATEEKGDKQKYAAIIEEIQKKYQKKFQQYRTELRNVKENQEKTDRRLGVVQKKMSMLEVQVENLKQRIYTEERINALIEGLDSKKVSEFYRILYNMLVNHFMAYRMVSTGFFNEDVREVTTFDNFVGSVCRLESIIEEIPVLGDLVGIPFKILNAFRGQKSDRLNSIIADKINNSRLQSEALITSYLSHLIKVLMNKKSFNARLEKAMKKEQKGHLEKIMDVFGELKEKIYRKALGGLKGEFSYAQQVVALYVTRFTLKLYEVDGKDFARQCKNEETFAAFFIGCFEDQAKQQSNIEEQRKDTICIKAVRFLFLIFLFGVILILIKGDEDFQKVSDIIAKGTLQLNELLAFYFPRLSEASSTPSEL